MTQAIPLKDFFRNPEQSSFMLSPNGELLAFLAPHNKRMNLFVRPTSGGPAKRLSNLSDRDLSSFTWISDKRLLYSRDFDGDENFHLFAVNTDGTNNVDLTPFPGVIAQLLDQLRHDSDHILIALNKRNPQFFDPFRLNIHTGELEMLAENPGNITTWITDHTGKLRIATATDGVNQSLLYRDKESEAFRPLCTTDFRESLSPLFFNFDNKTCFALSNIGRDKLAVIEYDLQEAKEIRVLFQHPEVDIEGMSFSRKRNVLTSINYYTEKQQFHFLDKEREALQKDLTTQLPGLEISLSSSNKAEDLYIIRTYSDRSLGAYYLYRKGEKVELISEVSPWLEPSELAEMHAVSYISRDGLNIPAYLSLPPNIKPEGLPVVINPHGGPWHRDKWGFNPEVQFLTNRGYAVLQMNFRGSTGYGRKFWEASFKEWGLKMQDDISDGVQWLINQGIADKNRIAIYGGSYGGYASLAGITLTPELYCCAIDYVGVSNLFTFMETIPAYWKPYLKMLHTMIGDPSLPEDYAQLEATSPVFMVENINCPLLIAQGAKDPRVVQSESDQMVAALLSRGIDVEYILKENEGHGFRNEENRFEFYERMELFLKKHL